MTLNSYNGELLLSVAGKVLVLVLVLVLVQVVPECSSFPPPPFHPIQPAAPAAVSKQMSERVPTPLPELPKPPAALEASAPALSREASLSAPPSSTLPSPPPSLYQGDVHNMHHTLKQRTTGKKKKKEKKKRHIDQKVRTFIKKKSKCHTSPKHLKITAKRSSRGK